MEANYFKFVQNEAFSESVLPFDHYYVFETSGTLIPEFENLHGSSVRVNRSRSADYSGIAPLARERLTAKLRLGARIRTKRVAALRGR